MGGVLAVQRELNGSRYELGECIAAGGMGAVYRGVQRGAAGFQRRVAIKRTHRHVLAMPDARETILREALYASAVRHPNVVSIDDVEEVDGELLLIMEYVEGISLAQLVKRCTLPVPVMVAIAIDACKGLHGIHSALGEGGGSLGLVHRDVSPQNILVGLDGIAKVTDFGIARRATDPKRTSKSLRRGKCGYMAPEYILTSEATPASDIFALAVVIWEGLARRRLFDGASDVEIIRKNLSAKVPALHLENEAITPALSEALRGALLHDVDLRFASADAFAVALEKAASSIATRAEIAEAVKEAMDRARDTKPSSGVRAIGHTGASSHENTPASDVHANTESEDGERQTILAASVAEPEDVEDPSEVRVSCRPTRPVAASEEETPASPSTEFAIRDLAPRSHPAFKLEDRVPSSPEWFVDEPVSTARSQITEAAPRSLGTRAPLLAVFAGIVVYALLALLAHRGVIALHLELPGLPR